MQDPLDVVYNGSKTLHAVQSGVVYGTSLCASSASSSCKADDVFRVGSLDVPVIKVGAGNASLHPDAPPLAGLNPAPVPNGEAILTLIVIVAPHCARIWFSLLPILLPFRSRPTASRRLRLQHLQQSLGYERHRVVSICGKGPALEIPFLNDGAVKWYPYVERDRHWKFRLDMKTPAADGGCTPRLAAKLGRRTDQS